MTRMNITLTLLLFLILYSSDYSQEPNSNKSDTQNLEIMDKEILYSLVTLSDKDRNYSTGFLIDLKGDTLVLLENNKRRDIPIEDLISISFETRRKGGREGVVIGGILGTYIFYVLAWQAEDEPFAYYEYDSPGGQLLVSLLGAFLGSGIGYLIDISTEESTEIFDFSRNNENRTEEYQRLKNFLTGNEPTSKLHLNFQLSQVTTRLSEEENNENLSPFAYRHITSFNLARKIQLTYSIFDELEIGGAVCWFGEPRVRWYSSSSATTEFSSGGHTYEGVGYYAIASYSPFKSIFPKTLSWKIGAGIGSGNVDYKFATVINSEYPYYRQVDTTIAEINKGLFSALIYTQFDLFIYDSFSLGLIADYVYLPEAIPGIPELNISSRKLGSFSFGLTLGLHF